MPSRTELYQEQKWEQPALYLQLERTDLSTANADKFSEINKRKENKLSMIDHVMGVQVDGKFKPFIPKVFVKGILQKLHENPLFAHMGARRLHAKFNESFVATALRKQAQEVTNSCQLCLQRKRPLQKVGELSSTLPKFPFETIAMDFAGPYHESRDGFKYVLVIIDLFTKYVEVVPCISANAHTVMDVLFKNIFMRYGHPKRLLSDNGSHFRNTLVEAYCKENGITKLYSSPYYPQGDGQVERFMRNMNDSLACLTNADPHGWSSFLPGIQFAYNTTKHASIKVTPHHALYCTEPPSPIVLPAADLALPDAAINYAKSRRLLVNEVRALVRKNAHLTWMERSIAYNQRRKKCSITVGSYAFVRLSPHQITQANLGKVKLLWSEPCLVLSVKASGQAFEVQNQDGKTMVVNASRLLPLPPDCWQPKGTLRINLAEELMRFSNKSEDLDEAKLEEPLDYHSSQEYTSDSSVSASSLAEPRLPADYALMIPGDCVANFARLRRSTLDSVDTVDSPRPHSLNHRYLFPFGYEREMRQRSGVPTHYPLPREVTKFTPSPPALALNDAHEAQPESSSVDIRTVSNHESIGPHGSVARTLSLDESLPSIEQQNDGSEDTSMSMDRVWISESSSSSAPTLESSPRSDDFAPNPQIVTREPNTISQVSDWVAQAPTIVRDIPLEYTPQHMTRRALKQLDLDDNVSLKIVGDHFKWADGLPYHGRRF
jgi:transposase InsO family protein